MFIKQCSKMALPMKNYLLIDAGGTFHKSAVSDSEGKIFHESAYSVKSFSDDSKEKILQAFNEIISKGLGFIQSNKMSLGGIGIAIPGPFDIEKAVPLMEHKFRNIYGVNLRDFFHEKHGIAHDIPIKFIHDANAVLAGELWKGNAKGFNNAAVVTLGTGLGFAVSQKGEILTNAIGGPHCSIFKLPYNKGILEDYVSKRGILETYNALKNSVLNENPEISQIAKWADDGDENSIQTFQKTGKILGESLEHILQEHRIECLLFGGQISNAFHLMEETIKKIFKDVACLKKIAQVSNIENAALWGALKAVLPND